MSMIVVYKSKYGSTQSYAELIAGRLGCRAIDAGSIKPSELDDFDTIIYGGGLYAEVINGITLINRNLDRLKNKKLIIFTTGLTPTDCRKYYDEMIISKNFRNGLPENVRIFNFPGKMIISELSVVHRAAVKTLKRIMADKKNPTEMERLLISLCDADGDFSDYSLIDKLVKYAECE